MSELNEQVNVLVEDASVITVPIDTTLTNSGEAADAKAVGDALALKADASAVTAITVNGEGADDQGHILIDGRDIPVSNTDTRKVDVAIAALGAKTASDIIYESTETIKAHVDALEDDVVRISVQELDGNEKSQARENIGAIGASDIAHIGTIVNGVAAQSTTVASSSYTNIYSMTLSAGTWIVWGGFSFNVAFSSGIGAAYICEGENRLDGTRSRASAVTGYKGGYTTLAIVSPTDDTEYSLCAYQNSGSSNDFVDAAFKAVRIA